MEVQDNALPTSAMPHMYSRGIDQPLTNSEDYV
jgi:hypothetical protein